MESLLWHLTNRTAETLLILNLFHLLLAGLAAMVLLHQRANRGAVARPDRLITLAFLLIATHFALLTLRFGAMFFFREPLRLAGVERVSHGLLVLGVVVLAAAYLDSGSAKRVRWLIPAMGGTVLLVLADMAAGSPASPLPQHPHSAPMFLSDAIAIATLLIGMHAVLSRACNWDGRGVRLLGLCSLLAVFVLHGVPMFVPGGESVLVWNCQEHLMSLALVALTWAIAERSQHLLDRVFVRLNLTFLILASLIMLTTASMEKYQYFRLAEERSVTLAEFLRGHYIYYSERGEDMQQIFDHPEVLRRVVTEFGSLPELREVDVFANGERAQFRYGDDWEVKEKIGPDGPDDNSDPELSNSFQMIRLPIARDKHNRIEFIGTLNYVNAYIGKYIIFIYCAFTVVLALGTAIIGIIVSDTDRQLKRQYAELQEAQQQLAQQAKLASIGELAGGMAHEINNPITGILALASHMTEGENAGSLNPRGRKSLRLIVKQAERVAALVGGLLSFSRQSQMHFGQVNVEELLDTAIDLVQYRLKGCAIQVSLEVAPNLAPVWGDVSRLTEVLVNLLTNAIDAMPNGGTLTVRAFAEDAGARVEVSDTGQGIAAEDLPRIFDPFFTTKAPGRGTGLGLSISHGIIKDHGGEIWATSQPGAGTTIAISLLTGVKEYETACTGH